MSRLKEEWRVGQPVWSKFGNVEWRPAVITKLGYKLIDVFFNTVRPYSAKKSYGKRLAENLRSRDPALKGKDKPESLIDTMLAQAAKIGGPPGQTGVPGVQGPSMSEGLWLPEKMQREKEV